MSKSAPRLGRGLSSIITAGPNPATGIQPQMIVANPEHHPLGAPIMLEIKSIRVSPDQPRHSFDSESLEALAASIRSNGIIQPLIVLPKREGVYELVAGERRLRAAVIAGLEKVPVIIRDLKPAEKLEIALIENLQREDLAPLDRAAGYQQYLERFDVSAEHLANRLGENRTTVLNYIRLLSLPEEVRELVQSGQLGMGQARAIAGILIPQRQIQLARLAVRRNLSVRQVEALARADQMPAADVAETVPPPDAHFARVERAFSKSLGVSVRLRPGRRKNAGQIIISYNSLEDFDRVAERLGVSPLLE